MVAGSNMCRRSVGRRISQPEMNHLDDAGQSA
jgi:hypothetical protein